MQTKDSLVIETGAPQESLFFALADAIPNIVWCTDPQGRLLFLNSYWCAYSGLTVDESMSGNGWMRAVHPQDRIKALRHWVLASRLGQVYELELRLRHASGAYRWHLAKGMPVRSGGRIAAWFGTCTDIDAHKQAEQQQAFLLRIEDALGATLNLSLSLDRIARFCVPRLCDWCQVALFDEHERLYVAAVAHGDAAKEAMLKRFVGKSPLCVDGEAGIQRAIRTGQPQLTSPFDPALLVSLVPAREDRAIYEVAGFQASLAVPLCAGGRVCGAMALVLADRARSFSEADVSLAQEMCRRVGIAVEQATSYEREHTIASTLQRALLPAELPELDDVEIHHAYLPAIGENEVGGDWYDAFLLEDGRLALSIGDVAGHGIEPAVIMGQVRQSIRTVAFDHDDPSRILSAVNHILVCQRRAPLVTAFFGFWNPRTHELLYAASGHPPPFLFTSEGNVHRLRYGGMPMGVLSEYEMPPPSSCLIKPGDTLVLFTDGLLEFSRNIEAAEVALEAALRSRIHEAGDNAAMELAQAVLTAPHMDDVAIMTMSPIAREPLVRLRLPATTRSAAIVRRHLRRFSKAHSLAHDREFDLLVAVGEAVANSIEHAYGHPTDAAEFEVQAFQTGSSIIATVRDFGRWGTSSSVDRGRGLSIIRETTRSHEVQISEAGTLIQMQL